jgi:hypothetical protein
MPVVDVPRSLSQIKALIHVPSDEKVPVAPFHASFTDSIIDSAHCSVDHCHSFSALDTSKGYEMLAFHCLSLINGSLRYNICDMPKELTLSCRERKNLAENIGKIPEALKYSCLYWVSHLALAN